VLLKPRGPQGAKYDIAGRTHTCTRAGDDLLLTPPAATILKIEAAAPKPLRLRQISEFVPAWEGMIGDRWHLLMVDKDGTLVGLTLAGMSEDAPSVDRVRFPVKP
jgi:hypothetical protein